MLSLDSVHIDFDRTPVFSDVNLHVAQSEICCVRTGVLDGSTSLLKCAAGIQAPAAGICMVDNQDIYQVSDEKLLQLVSYCYEAGGLVSLFNVYENIVLPLLYHGNINPTSLEAQVREVASALFIEECLVRQVHELNDVQTRMVNLARGIVIGSRLLLLDEIQEGMSVEMKNAVISFLQDKRESEGLTVVMTTTAGDDTSFADSVYAISDLSLKEER